MYLYVLIFLVKKYFFYDFRLKRFIFYSYNYNKNLYNNIYFKNCVRYMRILKSAIA